MLNTLSTESWNATDALSVVLDIMVTACTLLVYIMLSAAHLHEADRAGSGGDAVHFADCPIHDRSREVPGPTGEGRERRAGHAHAGNGRRRQIIGTFGRESHQQSRFEAVSQKLGSLCWKLGCIRGLLDPVYKLGGAALLVYILFTSGQDPANLGSALVFIFALYRAQPKMAALDGANVSLRAAAASIDAVTSLLNAADEPVTTTSGTRPFAGVRHGISFDRASFKYHPDDTFAIQDLSLHFPAGKTTALVGPSARASRRSSS